MKLIRMTDSASEKKMTRQTKGQNISKTSQDKETVIPLHSRKRGRYKPRKHPKSKKRLKQRKTSLSEFF